MAARLTETDLLLLKPGEFVGKHPDTGIIYRLTITTKGKITIERQPYVSPHDGWIKHYDDLIEEAERQLFLIMKIKANPAEWL